MVMNATGETENNIFVQIQNTCKGIVAAAEGAFVSFHANTLTYERIYNDFIPKIQTAINAMPPSEGFSVELKAALDPLALTLCGATSYVSDYQQLEILMDELLVLSLAAVPVDADGYVRVSKVDANGLPQSDVIPEMLGISAKLDAIVSIIG